MPTPETFDDILARAMTGAEKNAFDAAIEICRAMDGYCNQCCADAIERFRKSVHKQDNAPRLN